MKFKLMNDNIKKVGTKEELITLLKSYEGVLTSSMINYLNSLVELEFSVIRDYISDTERSCLSELEGYKRIAIYNIYNKALNIFKQSGLNFEMYGNNNGKEGLTVYVPLEERRTSLFDFDYEEESFGFKSRIPDGYKTAKIGKISLFQTIASEDQKEQELMRVMSILDKLYDERNPYSSRMDTFGGPSSLWALEHTNKIREYEEQFKQLDSQKGLTDDDKREIEITNQFHQLLLEDYGLTNKSFEDKGTKSSLKLQKTLVKKIPNITIESTIKYI